MSTDSPFLHHGLAMAVSLHDYSSCLNGPDSRRWQSLGFGNTISSHGPFTPGDGKGFLLSSVAWCRASLCGSLNCARTSTNSPFVHSLHLNSLNGILLPARMLIDEPHNGACIKETSRYSSFLPLFVTANFPEVSSIFLGYPS